MTGILQALLASISSAVSAITDQYFNYVTLLLPGNGTNGAQNNTFLDGSTNNFTITRNGNTTQGTFTPYGDNWSNYFDGSGDYLSATGSSATQMGTGAFTWECWCYVTTTASYQCLIDTRTSPSSGSSTGMALLLDTGTYTPIAATTSTVLTSSISVTANAWNHVALTRTSGGTLTIWVNGASGGTVSNSTNLTDTALWVGGNNTSPFPAYVNGYLSNVRIVKGSDLYTASFTPPTSPLTAITNTGFLTCQSNRFIDNSSNAFAITVNGNTSVQRFSPFSPTSAYSTSVIGGSGYFDGTGDYLSGPTNTATAFNLTGNFTIECWAYFNSVSTAFAGLASWSDSSGWNGWQFQNNAGTLTFEFLTGSAGVATVNSSTTMTTGQWYHLAVVRSSSTITLYINGVSVGTTTYSSSQTSSSSFIKIGADRLASALVTGYISNLRVVNGTAVYTAAFTPPTSPVTAITNTTLLCNFTNAGIIDNAMMNDLETVGNAQISTTQSKFGGSSMYFDGTGDYLVSADSPSWDLGNTFTVEGWIYPTSTTSYKTICAHGAGGWYLSIASGNLEAYDFTSGKTVTSATSSISTNSWQHIALVCNAGSAQFYINGTASGSATTGFVFSDVSGTFTVGEQGTYGYTFAGYIDDLRITKGVARYTANFTAPIAAFPTQ
jgi:hypothetical protein